MSITITTDIFCDYCRYWMHGISLSNSNKVAIKYTRAFATKQKGWIYKKINGKMVDLCPNCKVINLKDLQKRKEDNGL